MVMCSQLVYSSCMIRFGLLVLETFPTLSFQHVVVQGVASVRFQQKPLRLRLILTN